jgi:hypothetical protein
MSSVIDYLINLIPFYDNYDKNNSTKNNNIPDTIKADTIIQIDPNDMTIDIETGHLILVTHLSEKRY